MTIAGRPAQAPAAVMDVSERTFEAQVVQRSREVPVVVDFWAPWCGPCRTLSPTLERLAAEAKGAWVLAKVNVDENPRLSQMFGVQGIPAVKAVVNGRIAAEFTGAQPEGRVRAWLKQFVPESGDDLLAAAVALEATAPDEAAARYRLLLGEDPSNAEAQFNLGRLLLARNEPEGAALLGQIEPGTPFFSRAQALLPLADFYAVADDQGQAEGTEARYREAAVAARAGHHAEAMAGLLAIVARDRAFREDAARKTLLGLFGALGDEHPLTVEYRRKLANTLF